MILVSKESPCPPHSGDVHFLKIGPSVAEIDAVKVGAHSQHAEVIECLHLDQHVSGCSLAVRCAAAAARERNKWKSPMRFFAHNSGSRAPSYTIQRPLDSEVLRASFETSPILIRLLEPELDI